jgi:hypothetical protein
VGAAMAKDGHQVDTAVLHPRSSVCIDWHPVGIYRVTLAVVAPTSAEMTASPRAAARARPPWRETPST